MSSATSEPVDSGIEIANGYIPGYLYGATLECLRRVQSGLIRPDELEPHILLVEELHAHFQRGGSLVVFASGRHQLVPVPGPAPR